MILLIISPKIEKGFPGGFVSKESLQCRRAGLDPWVRSLGHQEDPLEKEMATYCGILAWKIQRSLLDYRPWGHKSRI